MVLVYICRRNRKSEEVMAKIPERKRSSDELARVQMRNAMQVRPPAVRFQRQMVQPMTLWICYLLSLMGLGVLLAPVLFFAKPLSRHHASFMLLLSFIVFGVAALYYYENYMRYAV